MHKATLKALERRRRKEEEQEERNRIQAGVEAQRRRTNPQYLTLLGEKSPGVDADNLHDALVAALRFARAFHLPLLPEGSTLLDWEERNFLEAHRVGFANMCEDGTLSELPIPKDIALKPFRECWVPLPNADQPITQAQMYSALAEIKGAGDGDGK
jgi:hypothetical protein